jgi:hypothetical protein
MDCLDSTNKLMADLATGGERIIIFTPDVRKDDVLAWFQINNKQSPYACFKTNGRVRIYLSDTQTIVELRLCWGDSIELLLETFGGDF